ncbi:unnamed protein product [Boreogadus saida]
MDRITSSTSNRSLPPSRVSSHGLVSFLKPQDVQRYDQSNGKPGECVVPECNGALPLPEIILEISPPPEPLADGEQPEARECEPPQAVGAQEPGPVEEGLAVPQGAAVVRVNPQAESGNLEDVEAESWSPLAVDNEDNGVGSNPQSPTPPPEDGNSVKKLSIDLPSKSAPR